MSTRATGGFNVVIKLSAVHVVPHIIADRLIATELDNLIPVIVGRKWQIAKGYHAVELRTTSKSALPPFYDGSCVTLCLNSAGDKQRIYPLLGVSSLPDGYVVGMRQEGDGRTDSLLTRFPLNERDEVFVGTPNSPPTILDDRARLSFLLVE
ncbi:hypothetical protein PQR02_38060 [Paraburkholderia sediminicola]|uniref:Uncharacterized protein n=1 Tax=Paraburkholderia rhynchosiae TaxID=487049 RepID=A0ACC7NNC8_9BURK